MRTIGDDPHGLPSHDAPPQAHPDGVAKLLGVSPTRVALYLAGMAEIGSATERLLWAAERDARLREALMADEWPPKRTKR